MDLNEEQLDAIVEKIKKPVAKLNGLLAELTMAHAYFEVVTALTLYEGMNDPERIKRRIIGSYEAFLKENPLPRSN